MHKDYIISQYKLEMSNFKTAKTEADRYEALGALHRLTNLAAQLYGFEFADSLITLQKGSDEMPKSNLAQSLTKRRFDYIRGMLAAGETQSRKEKDDVAKKFGVHPRTIYRWMDEPENMKLGDFYHLCDEYGLKISIELKDVPE